MGHAPTERDNPAIADKSHAILLDRSAAGKARIPAKMGVIESSSAFTDPTRVLESIGRAMDYASRSRF